MPVTNSQFIINWFKNKSWLSVSVLAAIVISSIVLELVFKANHHPESVLYFINTLLVVALSVWLMLDNTINPYSGKNLFWKICDYLAFCIYFDVYVIYAFKAAAYVVGLFH